MFGLFAKKSRLLCLAVHDTSVALAVVFGKSGASEDIRQFEQEALPEGAVKMGVIMKPDEVAAALKKAMARLKKKAFVKLPVVMSVPATLSYSAFIDDAKSANKAKNSVKDLLEQWLPFRAEELTFRQNSVPASPFHPAYTYVSALELKTLQAYRTLCRQAGLGSPECIPKTHALSRLAFGEKGPERYSLILDLTSSLPVVSLCIGNAVVDERVLFGGDPSAPLREALQSWVPKVTAQFREEKKPEPVKTPAKKKDTKDDDKANVKKEEKKKEEDSAKEKESAAPTPPVVQAKAQTVVRMVVFGEESKMFEAYASRLKNVSAVVTEFLPIENLATSFALGVSAAHGAKSPLPKFS